MSGIFKRNCLKFSALLLFMLFLQNIEAQVPSAELTAAIESRKKLLGNDFVVIVASKDSILYSKEWGEFNGKTPAPIASCSKWLTAALVMQFVDEGKLSLEDDVSRFLPEFGRYWKNHITIRQCLSHTTGIHADAARLTSLLQRKKFTSLEAEVNDFASREIDANPGVEFRYSNIGLNIAARVLEVISKKKFDVLIRQKLFVPLEMRNTTFGVYDGSAVNPSGGASSTANDYMHFLQMLLNNGVYKGKRILSEAAVTEMRKVQVAPAQIKYAPAVATGFTYALGSWVLEEGGVLANTLASPGLFGTWPYVDFCHGYTCLFFVKSLLSDQKADSYISMKHLIDAGFAGNCK